MKALSQLKDENFIAIAKLIDNNFIGNRKIIVHPMKMGIVKVTGHTEGGQCINCEVKIDIYMDKLNGVFSQDEDAEGGFRHIYPPILLRVIEYLTDNDFEYHQSLAKK